MENKQKAIEIPASNAGKIASIKAMQHSEGWALMLQVLTEQKDILERLIINAFNDRGEKLTPAEQDEARYKLGLVNDLINSPAGYIQALEQSGSEVTTFDPYYQKNSEIPKDER